MQDLIENKSFEKLTNEEKQIILNEMTVEEYQQQYHFLQETKAIWQAEHLAPSLAMQQQLQAEFAKKYSKTSIWQYRIKAWWAVLALLFVSGIFAFLYFQKINTPTPAPIKEIEQVFVYQTDTIYLEKEISTPVIKIKQKQPSKKIKKDVPIASIKQLQNDAFPVDPILTYNDTNAIKMAEDYAKGSKLDKDAPIIEVTVW